MYFKSLSKIIIFKSFKESFMSFLMWYKHYKTLVTMINQCFWKFKFHYIHFKLLHMFPQYIKNMIIKTYIYIYNVQY